jgi:hypothetical protein
VFKALRGENPYIWCAYSSEGHRDRHNREYTPQEVQLLLESAGYEVVGFDWAAFAGQPEDGLSAQRWRDPAPGC